MSLMNDYSLQVLAGQRQRELIAEAAERRLARTALEGRTPWWRRLVHGRDRSAAIGRPTLTAATHGATR